MALVTARGRIAIASGDTVGTTKTVSGLSFQPKLIFFQWNGRVSATDAVGRATHRRGFGAATSTTDRRGVTNTSFDAAGNADGGAYHHAAACVVQVSNTGGAIDGLADVNAINSDGFQLIVDDQFPNNLDVDWLAIGDDAGDITNVTTFQFQAPGTTGAQSQSITSLAFQPTGVIFFNIDLATAPPAGVSTNVQMGFGAATGPSDDHIWHGGMDEGSNTMDTQSYCRAGECIGMMPGTGGKLMDGRAEFTQFLSNGFQINWLEHAVINRYVFGVAIRGPQMAVFNGLTQTDTSTTTVVDFGFTPRAAILVSAGKAASAADTPTAHDSLSMAFIVSATDRGARAVLDEDNIGTSEVSQGVEFDACLQKISLTSTNDALMDVQSVDTDAGYTFIMDDADPAQSFFWGIAFGDAPPAGAGWGRLLGQERNHLVRAA